jgi:hypothetical protein
MHISTTALRAWNTPLSNAGLIIIDSLSHEGSLTITFRAKLDTGKTLLYFCFRRPHSYQLNPNFDSDRTVGNTLIQPKSRMHNIDLLINLESINRYVTSLGNESDLVTEFDRYVFNAEQATIEVFSLEEPEMGIIGRQQLTA